MRNEEIGRMDMYLDNCGIKDTRWKIASEMRGARSIST